MVVFLPFRILLIAYLAIILIFTMPPTWKCSDNCSLVFDTNRRCEFHRKTCPHFLEQLGTSSHYLGSDRQSENDGSSMGLTSELALYQLKRRRTDILNQAVSPFFALFRI